MEVVAYWIDVPDEMVDRLVNEGLIAECSVHGVFEVAASRKPDDLEQRIEDILDPLCPTCGHVIVHTPPGYACCVRHHEVCTKGGG